MITATIRDDYSGSGRVTQVCVGNVIVWTWAWHVDGPPSADLTDLLNTLDRYPSVTDHQAAPPNGTGLISEATCRHCGQPIEPDGDGWTHGYPSVTEEPCEKCGGTRRYTGNVGRAKNLPCPACMDHPTPENTAGLTDGYPSVTDEP